MNYSKKRIFLCVLNVTWGFLAPLNASLIHNDELVYKSLGTLGLSHYTKITEHYHQRIATSSTDQEREKIKDAYAILMHPTTKALHEMETFLAEFRLKATDKKIDKFQHFYGMFKQLRDDLIHSFQSAYNSSILDPSFESLEQQKQVGASLLKKYIAYSYQRFTDDQMTFYMDVATTERLYNEVLQTLAHIDHAPSYGALEIKLVDASRELLKTLKELPGFVQAIIRKTMAKKIKK